MHGELLRTLFSAAFATAPEWVIFTATFAFTLHLRDRSSDVAHTQDYRMPTASHVLHSHVLSRHVFTFMEPPLCIARWTLSLRVFFHDFAIRTSRTLGFVHDFIFGRAPFHLFLSFHFHAEHLFLHFSFPLDICILFAFLFAFSFVCSMHVFSLLFIYRGLLVHVFIAVFSRLLGYSHDRIVLRSRAFRSAGTHHCILPCTWSLLTFAIRFLGSSFASRTHTCVHRFCVFIHHFIVLPAHTIIADGHVCTFRITFTLRWMPFCFVRLRFNFLRFAFCVILSGCTLLRFTHVCGTHALSSSTPAFHASFAPQLPRVSLGLTRFAAAHHFVCVALPARVYAHCICVCFLRFFSHSFCASEHTHLRCVLSFLPLHFVCVSVCRVCILLVLHANAVLGGASFGFCVSARAGSLRLRLRSFWVYLGFRHVFACVYRLFTSRCPRFFFAFCRLCRVYTWLRCDLLVHTQRPFVYAFVRFGTTPLRTSAFPRVLFTLRANLHCAGISVCLTCLAHGISRNFTPALAIRFSVTSFVVLICDSAAFSRL